jgi:hypothetical protein
MTHQVVSLDDRGRLDLQCQALRHDSYVSMFVCVWNTDLISISRWEFNYLTFSNIIQFMTRS